MQEALQQLDESSRVLDLGCGPGSFSYEAVPARILALDEWVADADKTRRRIEGGRICYLLGSGQDLHVR